MRVFNLKSQERNVPHCLWKGEEKNNKWIVADKSVWSCYLASYYIFLFKGNQNYNLFFLSVQILFLLSFFLGIFMSFWKLICMVVILHNSEGESHSFSSTLKTEFLHRVNRGNFLSCLESWNRLNAVGFRIHCANYETH